MMCSAARRIFCEVELMDISIDQIGRVNKETGDENKLVAGGKIPIFFTDLCEENKVFENVEL